MLLGGWGQAQLPPSGLSLEASQLLLRARGPRSPHPPSHFIPVQHWGTLVGTQCCQPPAPITPRSLPAGGGSWVPPPRWGWWLWCPCGTWSPCSPIPRAPPGGCQGACGTLRAPRRARDGGHSWNPPVLASGPRSTPSPAPPATGSTGPSPGLLPGDRSCSAPTGDTRAGTAAVTSPAHCPAPGWGPVLLEGAIIFWRGSHHLRPLGMSTEEGEAENGGWGGCARRCQAGWGPLGVPQELGGRAPPAPALGFVSHLRASN